MTRSLDGTPAPPHTQIVYGPQRCPDHDDGGHRLADQGYVDYLFGHRYECSCGEATIGQTDRTRYNLWSRGRVNADGMWIDPQPMERPSVPEPVDQPWA